MRSGLTAALGAQPGRTRYSRRDKPAVAGLTTSGNVGIGTANPSNKLEVFTSNNGTVVPNFAIDSVSGAVKLRDNSYSLSVLANSSGNAGVIYSSSQLYLNSLITLSNNNPANGPDVYICRDGANILALRNDLIAQTSNIYNTFTARGAGTTSLEYFSTKAQSAGSFILQSTKGNIGGTARDIEIRHGATDTNGVITNGTLVINFAAAGVSVPGTLAVTGAATVTGLITANGGLQSGTGAGEIDVVSNSGALMGVRTVETVVSAMSGPTVTATALIPAGSFCCGITVRVTTLVTSAGATTFAVGDGTDPDCWGSAIAFALGTTSDSSKFNITGLPFYAGATNVVITANGGTFTAGAVRIAVHYITLTGPTS